MTPPLAFLHLTTFYPPYSFGGDGLHVERLARLLADHGHTVDVAHCADAYRLLHPGPPPLPSRPHPGVTVHALRSPWGRLSPVLTHATGGPGPKAGAIRALLQDRRYDVVHFHNVSLLGPRVLGLVPPGPVTLYTTHEQWLVCPTHVLWKFNRRPCERPQCVRCTLRAGRPPQLWRYTGLLERACRRVDAFVAPSRTVAALHAARGFPYPMTHLPNFAERADDDWRRPPPRPHARPYFLYVGRLETIKGVQALVDAWRGITAWDLVIAGTGTLAGELRRRAGDNPRVRFLGPVPPDQLGPLYVHALACVVPSLGHEVFPLVVLEALSRKVPVIAHDFGALGEVVAESEGGLLYRDESGLQAALARLAGAPDLRADLGERGYRTYLARWTPEAHLERYLALVSLHGRSGAPLDNPIRARAHR